MEKKDPEKHHFLYYIFQSDQTGHRLEKEKENALRQWFRKMLQIFHKGETSHE